MTLLAGTVARNLKTWNADSFDFDIVHVISNIFITALWEWTFTWSHTKQWVMLIYELHSWFHCVLVEELSTWMLWYFRYRIVKLKRTGFKTDGLAILVDRSIR